MRPREQVELGRSLREGGREGGMTAGRAPRGCGPGWSGPEEVLLPRQQEGVGATHPDSFGEMQGLPSAS